MSSVIDPHPEPPATEELVAYLDGELPPDDCRRIEERLAADADYRQQLRDLDQAWEALDVLPTPKTGDDFARTTMELVAVAAQADASTVTASAAAARRRRAGWFAAAGIAGVLLGAVAALLLLPNRNQALLRDLPMIRHVDVLTQIENVEFLRRLATEVPRERLMNDAAAIESKVMELAKVGAPSLETRRQWIEGLPADDKMALAAQEKRFNNLKPSPDEQERLRALWREVRAAGPNVERTLLAYDQWLSRLTAGKQDELRQELLDRPVEEQVQLVRQLSQREREQATRPLSPQEADGLRNELKLIAEERQSELVREFRRRGDKERLKRLEGPRAALMVLARELRNDDGNNQIRERLLNQLSSESRAHLESLHGWRRQAQLWKWIIESLQMRVDPNDLERFFADKLDNDQRERMLNRHSPSEMQAELERLYYATELGHGDAAQWWIELRESGDGMPIRPRQGGPGFRPDGPAGARGRPDGPPPEPFERGRMQREPGGPRPQDGPFPGVRRPPDGPGPRPQGPPPGDEQPRDI